MVRKSKNHTLIKGIATKISAGLKKDLDNIIIEYKKLGIELSYAEASEIYRRTK